MDAPELIAKLESERAKMERILSRFVRTSDSITIRQDDDRKYRQQILELRDLLSDEGLIQYSHQIVGFFNEGLVNFLESPSYASVESIIAVLGAVLTRLERNPGILKRREVAVESQANTPKRVFIGHGGSPVWKDIKDFLVDRLGLEYEEFNREPSAGKSTKERLEEMLNASSFALIVMTGEDETEGGRLRARENVVHEAGLFQGKLGFERAIILLEDGCEEFSNIHGLNQIRFPQGKIMAASEEIRRTLERERLVTRSKSANTEPMLDPLTNVTRTPAKPSRFYPGPEQSIDFPVEWCGTDTRIIVKDDEGCRVSAVEGRWTHFGLVAAFTTRSRTWSSWNGGTTARIAYLRHTTSGNETVRTVHNGLWLDAPSAQITINNNETRYLLLAIGSVQKPSEFCSAEDHRDTAHHSLGIEIRQISNTVRHVEVEIILDSGESKRFPFGINLKTLRLAARE
jgi:predicted nucleotide-binding protein